MDGIGLEYQSPTNVDWASTPPLPPCALCGCVPRSVRDLRSSEHEDFDPEVRAVTSTASAREARGHSAGGPAVDSAVNRFELTACAWVQWISPHDPIEPNHHHSAPAPRPPTPPRQLWDGSCARKEDVRTTQLSRSTTSTRSCSAAAPYTIHRARVYVGRCVHGRPGDGGGLVAAVSRGVVVATHIPRDTAELRTMHAFAASLGGGGRTQIKPGRAGGRAAPTSDDGQGSPLQVQAV